MSESRKIVSADTVHADAARFGKLCFRYKAASQVAEVLACVRDVAQVYQNAKSGVTRNALHLLTHQMHSCSLIRWNRVRYDKRTGLPRWGFTRFGKKAFALVHGTSVKKVRINAVPPLPLLAKAPTVKAALKVSRDDAIQTAQSIWVGRETTDVSQ